MWPYPKQNLPEVQAIYNLFEQSKKNHGFGFLWSVVIIAKLECVVAYAFNRLLNCHIIEGH